MNIDCYVPSLDSNTEPAKVDLQCLSAERLNAGQQETVVTTFVLALQPLPLEDEWS